MESVERKALLGSDDVGRVAAETLQQRWAGRRIIEIEGPQRYTQSEVASLLGAAVGRPVTARAVPREQWEALFQGEGTAWPAPRIEMLDGFNAGWIEFERRGTEHIAGRVPMADVLQALALAKSRAA